MSAGIPYGYQMRTVDRWLQRERKRGTISFSGKIWRVSLSKPNA